MRAKSVILLVIALGCGMVASVGISQVVFDKKDISGEAPTVEIFVAVKDLDTLQKLTEETVKLEKWPKDRLPEGAILKMAELESKYTNQRMYAGEPILSRKLMDSADDVSTKIPKGYRVFDLSVSDKNGGVGYIKPGDHVDVVGTFAVRGTSEGRTVMRNVKVFGINGNTIRESDASKNAKASTIQLLVKQSQLEALTLANSLSSDLRLSLRPPSDAQEESTDNGTEFLNWMKKSEQQSKPPEAAVTSILNFNTPREKTEVPKNQLLIITPSGVTTYNWSKSTDMPQRVSEVASERANNAAPTGAYLGTGGYAPSYPVSTGNPGSSSSQKGARQSATGTNQKKGTDDAQSTNSESQDQGDSEKKKPSLSQ